jgi:hypothetical protein
VVDGAALEKRCAKAPRVRIPPSPPLARNGRPATCRSASFSPERSPSGLWRRTGNAVRGNPSRVRIPPSPPPTDAPVSDRHGAARRFSWGARYPVARPESLTDSHRVTVRHDQGTRIACEQRPPRSPDRRGRSKMRISAAQRSPGENAPAATPPASHIGHRARTCQLRHRRRVATVTGRESATSLKPPTPDGTARPSAD